MGSLLTLSLALHGPGGASGEFRVSLIMSVLGPAQRCFSVHGAAAACEGLVWFFISSLPRCCIVKAVHFYLKKGLHSLVLRYGVRASAVGMRA
jgi:hypothetical protein